MIRHLVSTGAALGVSLFAASAMALSVTPTTNAADLAEAILGSGVTISNLALVAGPESAGTFTDGGNIGIDSGILLTSGSVNNALPPDTSESAGSSIGTGGDSDLNGLIPGYTTYDKTVLEFDFTTDSGDLYFNYVFGSEEYLEFVGSSFNDVFGFFVEGENIALVPGTSTAVSINNVHQATSNGYGSFAAVNGEYYVNNTANSVATQYDGVTTVLTASILGLEAGNTYHMKLAIADAGDTILDSGVFIQGGSFSSKPTAVPELSSSSATSALALLAMGALMMVGRRRRMA
ncbi:MAG: choice-of-anchor L domain-containing protein [Polyangiaceae bacterium]|nr:choice-of-anchor L domain-containing protein [Polyangiaceae bacterium]